MMSPFFRALLLASLFAVISSETTCEDLGYTESNYDTYIDHYGYTNQTFQMRYCFKDKHWRSDPSNPGPIFFYCGNEAPITTFIAASGYIDYLAEQMGALVIFGEHRYFGKSMPFGKESFTKKNNTRYLSPHQALGDYAYLLSAYKQTHYNAPVIAWGGSYGGMLSAWFRMKYPNIVLGSIAASAPIMHFEGTVDPELFYEIVTNDYANAAPECSAIIAQGFDSLQKFVKDPNVYYELRETFNLCEEIIHESDAQQIIDWLENAYVYMAMTDYPYKTNFLNPMPGNPVKVSCDAFQNLTTSSGAWDVLKAMRKSAEVYYNYNGDKTCNNIRGGNSNLGEEGWDYLSCTTLAIPNGTGNKDMFPSDPWSKSALDSYCIAAWGVSPQYNYAADFYGTSEQPVNVLQYFSNIVFSNGSLDPWQSGAVLMSVSENVIAFVMEGAAHHLDLRTPNAADPIEVHQGREIEKLAIQHWLEIDALERSS